MEQVKDTYQQSDISKKTEKGTQKFLRASDYVADLAATGIGKATDRAGAALSGFVKGITGGLVNPERIGYEMEKITNKAGKGLRMSRQGLSRFQLNPPGSFYASNLKRRGL